MEDRLTNKRIIISKKPFEYIECYRLANYDDEIFLPKGVDFQTVCYVIDTKVSTLEMSLVIKLIDTIYQKDPYDCTFDFYNINIPYLSKVKLDFLKNDNFINYSCQPPRPTAYALEVGACKSSD